MNPLIQNYVPPPLAFCADPVGVGVLLYHMQDISLTSRQIGTKFAWIYG